MARNYYKDGIPYAVLNRKEKFARYNISRDKNKIYYSYQLKDGISVVGEDGNNQDVGKTLSDFIKRIRLTGDTDMTMNLTKDKNLFPAGRIYGIRGTTTDNPFFSNEDEGGVFANVENINFITDVDIINLGGGDNLRYISDKELVGVESIPGDGRNVGTFSFAEDDKAFSLHTKVPNGDILVYNTNDKRTYLIKDTSNTSSPTTQEIIPFSFIVNMPFNYDEIYDIRVKDITELPNGGEYHILYMYNNAIYLSIIYMNYSGEIESTIEPKKCDFLIGEELPTIIDSRDNNIYIHDINDKKVHSYDVGNDIWSIIYDYDGEYSDKKFTEVKDYIIEFSRPKPRNIDGIDLYADNLIQDITTENNVHYDFITNNNIGIKIEWDNPNILTGQDRGDIIFYNAETFEEITGSERIEIKNFIINDTLINGLYNVYFFEDKKYIYILSLEDIYEQETGPNTFEKSASIFVSKISKDNVNDNWVERVDIYGLDKNDISDFFVPLNDFNVPFIKDESILIPYVLTTPNDENDFEKYTKANINFIYFKTKDLYEPKILLNASIGPNAVFDVSNEDLSYNYGRFFGLTPTSYDSGSLYCRITLLNEHNWINKKINFSYIRDNDTDEPLSTEFIFNNTTEDSGNISNSVDAKNWYADTLTEFTKKFVPIGENNFAVSFKVENSYISLYNIKFNFDEFDFYTNNVKERVKTDLDLTDYLFNVNNDLILLTTLNAKVIYFDKNTWEIDHETVSGDEDYIRSTDIKTTWKWYDPKMDSYNVGTILYGLVRKTTNDGFEDKKYYVYSNSNKETYLRSVNKETGEKSDVLYINTNDEVFFEDATFAQGDNPIFFGTHIYMINYENGILDDGNGFLTPYRYAKVKIDDDYCLRATWIERDSENTINLIGSAFNLNSKKYEKEEKENFNTYISKISNSLDILIEPQLQDLGYNSQPLNKKNQSDNHVWTRITQFGNEQVFVNPVLYDEIGEKYGFANEIWVDDLSMENRGEETPGTNEILSQPIFLTRNKLEHPTGDGGVNSYSYSASRIDIPVFKNSDGKYVNISFLLDAALRGVNTKYVDFEFETFAGLNQVIFLDYDENIINFEIADTNFTTGENLTDEEILNPDSFNDGNGNEAWNLFKTYPIVSGSVVKWEFWDITTLRYIELLWDAFEKTGSYSQSTTEWAVQLGSNVTDTMIPDVEYQSFGSNITGNPLNHKFSGEFLNSIYTGTVGAQPNGENSKDFATIDGNFGMDIADNRFYSFKTTAEPPERRWSTSNTLMIQDSFQHDALVGITFFPYRFYWTRPILNPKLFNVVELVDTSGEIESTYSSHTDLYKQYKNDMINGSLTWSGTTYNNHFVDQDSGLLSTSLKNEDVSSWSNSSVEDTKYLMLLPNDIYEVKGAIHASGDGENPQQYKSINAIEGIGSQIGAYRMEIPEAKGMYSRLNQDVFVNSEEAIKLGLRTKARIRFKFDSPSEFFRIGINGYGGNKITITQYDENFNLAVDASGDEVTPRTFQTANVQQQPNSAYKDIVLY